MSREDVLKKVINIYSDIVEENTGERPISREDGFDSLGIVDFFVAVEEECGVDLEDSIVQIREASVIENLVDIIYGRILG
jgi:acyl carrier protein